GAGLRIVVGHGVGLFDTYEPVAPMLVTAREAEANAVLVLSAYGALAPVQRALAEATSGDWQPRLVQNMTWVGITAFGTTGDFDGQALRRDFEGWIGLDQIHERNETFRAVLDRFE